MRLFYFLYFVIFISLPLQAQQPDGQSLITFGNYSSALGAYQAPNRVYLMKKWALGSVVTTSSIKYGGLLLKYDLENQILVVKADEKNIKVVKDGSLDQFTLKDEKGLKREFINASSYQYKDERMDGFIEIITQDDFTLAYKYIIKKPLFDNSENMVNPAFIKQVVLLYADKNSKEFVSISKKKELANIFTDKEKEMKTYLKKYVKLKDIQSMKAAVKLYQILKKNSPVYRSSL